MPPPLPTRRYLQLDVFAQRAGAGNGLGVVLDAQGMDAAGMQALAAWLNLSETIFFLPPDAGADYRIRIFTPASELPFAGHPSVGAAWAAIHTGLAHPHDGTLVQQCAAGLLPVRVDGGLVRVRAPRAHCIEDAPSQHAKALAAAIATQRCGSLAPALWDNGPRWWLVQLADADAVRTLAPDLPAIAGLCRESDAVGLAVHAIAGQPDHAVVVRAFCPADGIPEDPVTGSANACVAAALAQAGCLPDTRYIASQGRELGRDGRVDVEVDAAGEVWIGGAVQCVIEGVLRWEEALA